MNNNPFQFFFAKIAASTFAMVLCGLAAVGLLVICCCVCAPLLSAIGESGSAQ